MISSDLETSIWYSHWLIWMKINLLNSSNFVRYMVSNIHIRVYPNMYIISLDLMDLSDESQSYRHQLLR